MIKRNNKKGFTIVELVIVIAVIAILAAVLIPTFAGIINKANQSADQQAVRQMNTLLASESLTGEGPTKIQDVKAILDANGYNHKLDPLFKGYSFAWIAEKNVIVLVEDGKVVFPEEYADYDFAKVELFNVVKVGSADDIKNLASGEFADINGLNSVVLEENINVFEGENGVACLFLNNSGDLEIDGNGNTLETVLYVADGNSLTLTNVTIDATNRPNKSYSTIYPSSGSVYMSNATIKSDAWGYAQNVGSAADSNFDVVSVAKDSTFDAPMSLYIGRGDWVFENCTFIGTVTISGCANATFKNCTFTAKTGIDYVDDAAYATSASGCFTSQNAIVVVQGRDSESYQSGKVTFTGCTVTNAEGANVSTEGGANYRFCTYTGTVKNPNKITVEWN